LISLKIEISSYFSLLQTRYFHPCNIFIFNHGIQHPAPCLLSQSARNIHKHLIIAKCILTAIGGASFGVWCRNPSAGLVKVLSKYFILDSGEGYLHPSDFFAQLFHPEDSQHIP
jgi:hypothetical protein